MSRMSTPEARRVKSGGSARARHLFNPQVKLQKRNNLMKEAGGTYGSTKAAEGWRRRGSALAEFLGPLTERML